MLTLLMHELRICLLCWQTGKVSRCGGSGTGPSVHALHIDLLVWKVDAAHAASQGCAGFTSSPRCAGNRLAWLCTGSVFVCYGDMLHSQPAKGCA
jgi:hypothetical protein